MLRLWPVASAIVSELTCVSCQQFDLRRSFMKCRMGSVSRHRGRRVFTIIPPWQQGRVSGQ